MPVEFSWDLSWRCGFSESGCWLPHNGFFDDTLRVCGGTELSSMRPDAGTMAGLLPAITKTSTDNVSFMEEMLSGLTDKRQEFGLMECDDCSMHEELGWPKSGWSLLENGRTGSRARCYQFSQFPSRLWWSFSFIIWDDNLPLSKEGDTLWNHLSRVIDHHKYEVQLFTWS